MRITIDENIKFIDMLKGTKDLKMGRAQLDKKVVEFKFPPRLKDQAAELMRTLPNYPSRSSKYVTGLSMFGHVAHI